jgi:hypothetical protein
MWKQEQQMKQEENSSETRGNDVVEGRQQCETREQ